MDELRARQIAEEAHKDHKNSKTGAPYFAHVKRVAAYADRFAYHALDSHFEVTDIEGQSQFLTDCAVVAWLHDVLEDHPKMALTFWNELNEVQAEALLLMTHEKNEPYADYIDKGKYNRIFRVVKLADLEDNTDPERRHLLDEETVARLDKKYLPAKEKLNAIERAAVR